MKRILIIVALVIVIYFGITTVANGFENESLKLNVSSYKAIQEKSDSLTMAVSAYNKKNDTDYENEMLNLNNSIKKYKNSKTIYEELIEDLNSQGKLNQIVEEQIIYSPKSIYDVDFLQTRIGTYANKNGLELTLRLNSSDYVDPSAEAQDFTVCNLRFMVTGQYIKIADFLYNIEGDDKLAFEIRDYNMAKEEADFTVYNVRVSNESLLQLQSSETGSEVDGGDPMTSTGTNNTTTTNNNTNSTVTPGTTQNTTGTQGTSNTSTVTTTNTSTTTTPVNNAQ